MGNEYDDIDTDLRKEMNAWEALGDEAWKMIEEWERDNFLNSVEANGGCDGR